jgi:hypothetical protein
MSMQLRITNYELPSRLAGVAADADAGQVEHRQQHVVAARVGFGVVVAAEAVTAPRTFTRRMSHTRGSLRATTSTAPSA